MKLRLTVLIVALGTMLLSACTWVRMEPGADEVLLLPERRTTNCEKLGTVEVSVLARVAGLDRHEEEIESDLANLARNHAVERGGDTIAALSEIEDGKQRFGVYRCENGAPAATGDNDEDDGVRVRGYNG